MDIIYHRNCLDGVFSAHLFYLLSKVINQQKLNQFCKQMQQKIFLKEKLSVETLNYQLQYQKLVDLTSQIYQKTQNVFDKSQKQNQFQINIINEDFFHKPNKGVNYSAYSLFAGEFIPLKFPHKNKILFILDTGLVNYQNILNIGQKYDFVIIIDHHTSFQPIKKDILLNKNKMKKLFYCYTQKICATAISYLFLQKYFKIQKYFQKKHIQDLKRIIQFVGNNDLKINQNKLSKSFVLGFYYFQIQLSHMNPLLNKRLGLLNLQYLLEKGSNLYKMHLKQLSNQIKDAMICQLNLSGSINKIRFYILRPANPKKISDIGIILAYLSKIHQMENLAVLYIPKPDQIRVSTRSVRSQPSPLALILAQKYQGGGHVCAAGFKISSNKFKSNFIKIPVDKQKLNLTVEQIQNILFKNSTQN